MYLSCLFNVIFVIKYKRLNSLLFCHLEFDKKALTFGFFMAHSVFFFLDNMSAITTSILEVQPLCKKKIYVTDSLTHSRDN